jgi:F-type H+-transporting ATPase subunit epsilon
MPDLQLVLVTPEKTLLDEPVAALRFPLFDGQIGIMPGRAPMVGRLGYGELKIRTASGDQSFYIDGGFVQVKGPTVSLLTNRAIPAGKIDADEARRLLDDAARKPGRTDVEYALKERDLERGRRMLAMS